ncbi:CinA family protein [Aggregatilinea lenta]|uniref:CinA family protein n=1 Tax=Aggregatilinea lenta TaxID=913108 RepID=UPI000E5A4838|nr:CinA family protein [Aggregatilinea lenta]
MPDPELLTSNSELDHHVQHVLTARQLTIATAESSTGGLIAARLTALSGSSAYVMGGVVTYSDQFKRDLLGVRQEALSGYGAVSEPVARQMADGVRELLRTDLAVSVTGIAGPTGETPTKPLGLHFIGLSTTEGTWVRRFIFEGNRGENRQAAADAAFKLVLDYLDRNL